VFHNHGIVIHGGSNPHAHNDEELCEIEPVARGKINKRVKGQQLSFMENYSLNYSIKERQENEVDKF